MAEKVATIFSLPTGNTHKEIKGVPDDLLERSLQDAV